MHMEPYVSNLLLYIISLVPKLRYFTILEKCQVVLSDGANSDTYSGMLSQKDLGLIGVVTHFLSCKLLLTTSIMGFSGYLRMLRNGRLRPGECFGTRRVRNRLPG